MLKSNWKFGYGVGTFMQSESGNTMTILRIMNYEFWSCVLAKNFINNSGPLFPVCKLFIFMCCFKDFRPIPTECGVAARPVHRSLRQPYVVRFCTFQNIFTWEIYRFLPGRDLVPICWRTHSWEIYRRATPLFAKRIALGVKVMVHYEGHATKPAQIWDLPTS